ncbi:MAG: nuclear transport factor 2 family protein [Rhodospirillaceae bacterium]|nr:nuclear transport factor 2 family protein [Rhodospirillaceae bacterium]
MNGTHADLLQEYLALWADASPSRDLSKLDQLTTADICFKDPINDVTGRDALKEIFRDAAAAISDQRVDILGIGWVGTQRAFVKWHYSGRLRRLGGRAWAVSGMSDMVLSSEGLVMSHEDHWDLAGGLYAYFPVLGWLLRRLRERLRLH